MRVREIATYRCPCCGAQIRTLADEIYDHGCARCGWEPGDKPPLDDEDDEYEREAV